MPSNVQFRWRYGRLLLSLLLYLFLSGASLDAGTAMFLVLVISIICMATERGQWKAWQTVGFVLLTMPTLVLLTVLLVRFGGFNIDSEYLVREPPLPKRAVFALPMLVAGFPVLLFAMRRSSLFVRSV